nr:uncharacterized protein LOC124220962 [Neodiprion pinetum]
MAPVKKQKQQLHQLKQETESDMKEVNNNSAAGCEKIIALPAWTPPTIFKLKSKEDEKHVQKFYAGTSQQQTLVSLVTAKTHDDVWTSATVLKLDNQEEEKHVRSSDAGTSQQQTSISSVSIKKRDDLSRGNAELDIPTPKSRTRNSLPKRLIASQPSVIDSESPNEATNITTDSILKFIKPPPECSYITRSLLKKLKASKLRNVNNDDSEINNKGTPTVTSAKTHSVPEVTKEKTKCTYMCGEKLAKKSRKSKSVGTSSNASADSKDFNFTSLKEMDSTPEMGKLNSKCNRNWKDLTSWRKSQKLQPSDNLDTANDDTMIASQVRNNSMSKTAVCKTTCTRECREKLYDHCGDSLSDSTNKVDSISTSIKSQIEFMYEETDKLQGNLVQSEIVNISITPEPEAKINVSKRKTVKRRSIKVIDKLKSSGTLMVNKNSSVRSVDLSSTSCTESDSTPHVPTEKVKCTRQPKNRVQKDLIKTNQLKRPSILTCKVENNYPPTRIITDSTSETSKSETVMTECLPKPVVSSEKMLLSSNQEEMGKVENTYPATGTITDSTSETSMSEIVMAEYLPKPVVKRRKMRMSSNQEETGKVENMYPATGTITDSISETSKSKIVMFECLPKPVVEYQKMQMSSNQEEMVDTHVVKDSVSTKMPKPNIQMTHECRAAKAQTNSQTPETNDEALSEIVFTPSKHSTNIGIAISPSKSTSTRTRKWIRVQKNLMNSTVEGMEYHPVIKTKGSVCESNKKKYSAELNTKDLDNDECIFTKCKERLSSISDVVKNEDLLHSNLYQPRVLLRDIAYDKELPQKQRDILLKKNTSRDVTATLSTKQWIKCNTSEVFSESFSENDQSLTSSNTDLIVHRHKCPNLQEQQLHTPFLLMDPGPIEPVRGTNSSSTVSDADGLSSLIEYPLKGQKFSDATGLPLEPCSPTKIHNIEKNLTEPIVTDQENNLTEALFKKGDLEFPLDLRVNASITSATNESQFLPCNDNSVKLDTSDFNLTNNSDECNNEKLMPCHSILQVAESIQVRCTDSICNPNRTPVKSEKLNSSNGLSLKVSIPICFTDTNSGQVVKLLKEEKLALVNKSETHSSLKLLEIQGVKKSQETKEIILGEKSNVPFDLIEDPKSAGADNNYDNIGLTTTLDLINIEDDNRSCFAETLKNCSTDISSVPTVAEQPIHQSTPIGKKRPKIVSDEILPKDTITFPCSKDVSLELFKSDTNDRMHQNDLDDVGKNQDWLMAFNSHSAEQDDKNNIKSEHSWGKRDTDPIPSTGAQPFDPSKLLTYYCPELATFYSINDSTKNNQSEITLPDPDVFNNNSRLNHNALSVPNTVETETNAGNTDLSLKDDVGISKGKTELGNAFGGVVASRVDYVDNKMDTESSEIIDTESTSKPSPLIAELTIANLRNFTKISNTTAESERTWCVETHQYYTSHKDEKRKKLPNINEVPDNRNDLSEATKSELENQTQSLPMKMKQRKRKWISDNSNKAQDPAPLSGKRIQLKRNRWSVSGPGDLESTMNYPKSNSAKSNTSIVSTGSSTVAQNKQSSKNGSPIKKFVVPTNDETQQLELKTENLLPNMNILPTSFGKTNIDNNSESSKYSFCEGNILPKWPSTSPKDTEGFNCNSDFNKNGNLTNSVSASPLSSQNSVLNIRESDRSTLTKEIIGQNLGKSDIGLDKGQSTNESAKEDLDYEYDDCISLFAESIVITNVDQSINFMDGAKTSPCKTQNSSERSYEDIKDFAAYYNKNLEECNAAYEFGYETERNGYTTSNIIIPFDTKNSNNCLNFNNNSSNTIPVPQVNTQYSETEFSSAINPPISNLNSSSSMRGRLGIRQETQNAVSTFTSRIFWRHCFHILRFGYCKRKHCHFIHNLTPSLQNLDQKDLDYIVEVIAYSKINGFTHLIKNVYHQVVTQMDARNIIELFHKLYCKRQLNEHLVNCTVHALISTGMSLPNIFSNMALLLDENDSGLIEYLIEFIGEMTQPGTYWDTFRDFLIKIPPSGRRIARVIHELVDINKDKSHIEDVYRNFINKLSLNQVSMININLRNRLNSILMKNDIIHRNIQYSYTPVSTQNDSSNLMLETNVGRDINKELIEIPGIHSPDSTQYSDSGLLLSRTSQRSSLQGPANTSSLFISRDDSPRSMAADPNVFNQKRNAGIRSNPLVTKFSATSSSRTSEAEAEAVDLTSDSYKVHLIENLKEPQSVYRNRHWQFHLDMTIVKESLKHQDYEGVLKILNKYSNVVGKTLFTTSCYRMLHKNVIMSAYHMKNMIKLSVRMGVNKSLSQTLFYLGIYTMIELCDAGAWVIAYSLFKPLQATGLMENIAEYALISAEICIANGRPLKAFTILKQSNMFCTNPSKWLVTSNPNDERVRVMIINLLLDVLCQELPEQAFYIFTYLLGDQSRIYHPIDLTAYTDNLVTGILNGKCNDLVPEIAKIIIENNFSLSNSVFQSLVINLFKKDLKRCKQLYRYGTWLGVYPIVGLTVPLRILIKTNWMREEIYLAVLNFLETLSVEVGHAVDQIRPHQFSIHLVFELAPFKQQLPDSEDQICNSDELKMSKKLMKTVLQEEFYPPLKTGCKERERLMKLQSRTVVNYLKCMSALQ